MPDQETIPAPESRWRHRAEQAVRERVAAQPGEPAALPSAGMPRWLHELQVQQVEIELLTEELRRTQAELESAPASGAAWPEHAPAAHLTIDEQGLILEATPAMASLLGMAREALLRLPLSRLLQKEDQATYYRYRQRLRDTGVAPALELRLVRADATAVWAYAETATTEGPAGTRAHRVVVSDHPGREPTEAALRAASLYARSLIESSLDPLVTISAEGRITDVNTATERITGVSREQLIGSDFAGYCTDPEKARAGYREAFAEGFVVDYPLAIRHASGASIEVLYNASVYRDEQGHVLGVFAAARDLTALKRAEEARRESEANFRTFFETITDVLVAGTPDGRLLYCNPATSRTLGYTQDELRGMPLLDLHPPSKRREAEGIFAAMLRGERACCPLPLMAKDGTLVPVETRVWFGKWNGAECIFGVCKDLTAEQEAKQLFERLFRSNPSLAALSVLPERRFTDVNDAFLKTLGYAREDILGKTSAELGLFVRPEALAVAEAALLTTERCADLELQIRRRDGVVIDGLFSGEVISSQGRQYLLTVMVDITERKRIEEALGRERERLAGIIEGTHVGTWEWNVQTGETVFNELWADILGYTLAELAPVSIATWKRLTHPDDLAQCDVLLQRHFRKELDYYECESRLRHKEGHWVWVLDRGRVASWTADGRPLRMLGTHQDITPRKRAAEELARLSVIQGELMRLATKFVNVPVDLQDTAIDQSLASIGRLIKADRAYLCTYDFSANVISNTHEWCGPDVLSAVSDMQAVPIARFAEWVERHRHGEAVHIPNTADLPSDSPLRQLLEAQEIRSVITLPVLQERTCLGFVGFDAVRGKRVWREEEISLLRMLARLYAHFAARRTADRESRELQKRLAQARDGAQEAALAKGLFLANMSHEIRTPLNAILGYAQIMERDCRNCPAGERLHAITRSGEHLLELITDLMELVRSDTHVIPLVTTEFDFPQVLEDVRLMFAQQPAAQRLSLAVSCAPEVPRFISTDQGKVRQVLANLVGNALKFTEKGTVVLAASVLAGGTLDQLTLSVAVTDTGCGIRADELERIFDIFYLAGGDQRAAKGTGLGLPLSRRYARALGGDVTVASRLGEGSSFRFTFSARIAKGSTAKEPRQRTVMRLVSGQPAPRVLAVDDDPMSRSMLTAMLQPVGFAVEAVSSAAEALERLRQPPGIGLVLLDKNMPGMDGYTAIGHIRRLPGGTDIRVVIVTAVGFAAERARALAAGADGYVAKPVHRKALMAEISRVTGVQYDYDEVAASAPAAARSAALAPEELARLPAEQQRGLEEALRRGDIRQLRDLVEMIAHADADLAAGIRVLVDAYDYDRLHRLLRAAKGEAP